MRSSGFDRLGASTPALHNRLCERSLLNHRNFIFSNLRFPVGETSNNASASSYRKLSTLPNRTGTSANHADLKLPRAKFRRNSGAVSPVPVPRYDSEYNGIV